MKKLAPLIDEEAKAFDERISERVNAGFIPDIRRAVKCEYFYKSFWRDPQFIALYLGKTIEAYLELLVRYSRPGATILDIGCGAGYVSLELARNGYHVTAFDISSACISQAERMLSQNPYREGFGSLKYSVMELDHAFGNYDVVLFSGVLHHMTDLTRALDKAHTLLNPNGTILCYEPCHDRWTYADAAQVALIRGILSITQHWYESDAIISQISDERTLEHLIAEIYEEYVEERDKHEGGQSPHDNEYDGAEMLYGLRSRFDELETRLGHSFIYRILGGIRGNEQIIAKLADFLALYDRLAVKNGHMNPNGFFFIGQK